MPTQSTRTDDVQTNGGAEAATEEQARIDHLTAAITAPPPTPHGSGIRGLSLAGGSPATGGRFGRLFPSLPPADFGATDDQSQSALAKLGRAMEATKEAPKDGPDNEESGIPGRVHLFRSVHRPRPHLRPRQQPCSSQNDPDALVDFRTPALRPRQRLRPRARRPALPVLRTGGTSCWAARSPARPWAIRQRAGPAAQQRHRPVTPAAPRHHRRPAQRRERHRLPAAGRFMLRFHNRLADDNPGMDVRRRAAPGALSLPVGRPQRLPAHDRLLRRAGRGAAACRQAVRRIRDPPNLLFFRLAAQPVHAARVLGRGLPASVTR